MDVTKRARQRKGKRPYQPRCGHPRPLVTIRMEPGLLYRLRILADDQHTSLAGLLERNLEPIVSREGITSNDAKA